ncbi:MAG TPA: ornithine cyclodeaminase family protein [Bauldia sp.]|nr:ornithine cyclodeaminase family protein [Bauldia sp.]
MRVISAAEINATLDFPGLIAAIGDAFRAGVSAPPRHHHRIGQATLLLMPAWQAAGGGFIGVKLVSVFPDNATRALPTVMGTYVLMAGDSGAPLAALDGVSLTLWRTAATSALAADTLARPEASRLAMIGAGALAPYLIRAHASVRRLNRVTIWNRTFERSERVAAEVAEIGIKATATSDRADAIRGADIVSVATLSEAPLVEGAWLKPGTHVDLVGAYTPAMREADDEAVRRASVYVDTRGGMRESGDIAQPLASGALSEGRIAGDLFDIAAGRARRRSADEITLFKSVGYAAEDLAGAVEVWRRLNP